MKFDHCNQLEDYVDDCLSSEEKSSFEDHLETCTVCQLELTQIRELDKSICAIWSDVRIPDDLKSVSPAEGDANFLPAPHKKHRTIAWASMTGLASAILMTFFLTARQPVNIDATLTSRSETTEKSDVVQPVAFYESGDNGTLLAPIVSTAEFTIVNAFPVSASTNINPESTQ